MHYATLLLLLLTTFHITRSFPAVNCPFFTKPQYIHIDIIAGNSADLIGGEDFMEVRNDRDDHHPRHHQSPTPSKQGKAPINSVDTNSVTQRSFLYTYMCVYIALIFIFLIVLFDFVIL